MKLKKSTWAVAALAVLVLIPVSIQALSWAQLHAVAVANREWAEWDRLKDATETSIRERRFDEAERLAKETKDLARRLTHGPHWRVASSDYSLGAVYYVQDRFAEAAPQFQEDVDIREQCDGPNADELVMPLVRLADVYTHLEKPDLALKDAERALAIREGEYKDKNGELVVPLEALAAVREARGEYDAAEKLRSRVVDIRAYLVNSATRDLAGAYFRAGRTQKEKGDKSAAEGLFKLGLKSLRGSGLTDTNLIGEFHDELKALLEKEKAGGQ